MAPAQSKQPYPFCFLASSRLNVLNYVLVPMPMSPVIRIPGVAASSESPTDGSADRSGRVLHAPARRDESTAQHKQTLANAVKDVVSHKGTRKLNMLELTGIAASSGALGGLAGNPADIVLVRMVSDPTKPPEKQVHYRNALHGVYKMVQVEGFGSLFRGLMPNTLTPGPWCAHELGPARVLRHVQVDAVGLRHVGRSATARPRLLPQWHDCDDDLLAGGRDQVARHALDRPARTDARPDRVDAEGGSRIPVQGLDAELDPPHAQHDLHLRLPRAA
ncbi:dicarboxylic acid transporter [Trichosporon asahii var. asahii CBS 2479]|uniref:Dicarboxylic acid transporter n=1 Tax=Trichosporon asahii var. asahii (strain ATCC 90039 / CBS 2479 / JCM 2466 / KCTC 7840 / NBRC 103889/ NCYC 2677 / UAMH 7654) TaxID=1186058 RepID=J6EMK2_TRIAS|nr:dicarboxylic acid transporter [Trichosporon asahii var. asahii CBS 2479]EJT45519.1 dicarboxylic acid transporter [Trichosporon asahii var. asahii CBS 2479]